MPVLYHTGKPPAKPGKPAEARLDGPGPKPLKPVVGTDTDTVGVLSRAELQALNEQSVDERLKQAERRAVHVCDHE